MQPQLDRQREIAAAILDALPDQVISPRRLDILAHPDRLAIHARNMRASLSAALASIFPATQRLTGDGFFAYATAQFIAASPPRDPVVDSYGEGLSSFLQAFSPAAHLSWLPDLARLEWMLHDLSRATPAMPFTPDDLPDAPDFSVSFSASSGLFSSAWPVDLIRTSADSDGIDLTLPARLLLWTEDDGVAVSRLDASEHAFILALRDGHQLSIAMADAARFDPAFQASTALSRLFAAGCITALHALDGNQS
jgi:hypothetical protein